MNNIERFEEFRSKSPIVAILRGITLSEIHEVCDALYDGGVYMLEVTLNTPNALAIIREASAHCGERQFVGAGTVLTPDEVHQAAEAGAHFIISPNVNVEVIQETVAEGLVSMPGFYTPTEAFTAIDAGAHYLKLFPAGGLGPGYIKDLKAVVKKPIMAVGGINAANIADFLAVCSGVGIGSTLYKPGRAASEIRAIAEKLSDSCPTGH